MEPKGDCPHMTLRARIPMCSCAHASETAVAWQLVADASYFTGRSICVDSGVTDHL